MHLRNGCRIASCADAAESIYSISPLPSPEEGTKSGFQKANQFMTFKFTSQKLLNGLFEPEGIYLASPTEGEAQALQGYGDNASYYGQWNYNGVPLKGHTGIDLHVGAGAALLAVDNGRIVEISQEKGGFERYIKVEHRWGESIYGNCGEVLVETGQSVTRGEAIARAPVAQPPLRTATAASGKQRSAAFDSIWFHFGVRISPFNRYDGWGGFADPMPFLPPGSVLLPDDTDEKVQAGYEPHPMAEDKPGLRRP